MTTKQKIEKIIKETSAVYDGDRYIVVEKNTIEDKITDDLLPYYSELQKDNLACIEYPHEIKKETIDEKIW